MATGATTGSRGGGSMQPGGHPAASPAHAAGAVHPARGLHEGAAAPSGRPSRSGGGAAGLGGAGDHFGAPTHTGGPERPAGAHDDRGVLDDRRTRGPWRQGESGRGPVGPGRWDAPVRRFGSPDHRIGHPDHWPGGIRPGLVGRRQWFHPGHRWPWLYRGAWVEGGVPSPTVTWAQACLSRLLGIELPQDGFVGPDTQQAIASFQAQQNLPPTGTLDDNTVSALQVICGDLRERDYDGEPGEYEEFVDPFEERDIARKTSPVPATSQVGRRAAVAQAQNLINRFRRATYAGKWHPSLSRQEVANRLLTLINNPDLVNQGANGLCGEAAFFNVWLWEDPLAVARFGVQLFNSGAASIGVDEWIRTRPSLRSQNFNKVVLQMPGFPHAADWSAEWMLMSALRDASNWVISYDGTPSDEWGAGSSNREVTHWLRATGLFGKVSCETGNALKLNPGNDIILVACDSHMLGNPSHPGGPEDDHWLVLRSAIIGEDNATVNFRFWCWGEPIQWVNDRRADQTRVGTPLPGPLSKSQFLNEYFGYIRAQR
jgi:Putative peptidoglycan binding domain